VIQAASARCAGFCRHGRGNSLNISRLSKEGWRENQFLIISNDEALLEIQQGFMSSPSYFA